MTKIRFFKKGEDFVRIESRGHSGYAKSGEDIVCAGISSLTQGAALGIMKVVGVNAQYAIDEKKGELILELPEDISEEKMHDCSVLLKTLYLSVSDLAEEYSEFISVEVK